MPAPSGALSYEILGMWLLCGRPGRWWFLPCAGGGLTHRKRSPLPFREGIFFVRGRRSISGQMVFLPCAGGGLTHRKRSPLPFREGIFLFGGVGVYPGRWRFLPCAGGRTHPPQAVPPSLSGRVFFLFGGIGYFCLPSLREVRRCVRRKVSLCGFSLKMMLLCYEGMGLHIFRF